MVGIVSMVRSVETLVAVMVDQAGTGWTVAESRLDVIYLIARDGLVHTVMMSTPS